MSLVACTGRRGKLNSEGESGLTLNAYRIDRSLRERDFRWFVSKLHINNWMERRGSTIYPETARIAELNQRLNTAIH